MGTTALSSMTWTGSSTSKVMRGVAVEYGDGRRVLLQQLSGDLGADETGAAGDENAHGSLHGISRVCCSPGKKDREKPASTRRGRNGFDDLVDSGDVPVDCR